MKARVSRPVRAAGARVATEQPPVRPSATAPFRAPQGSALISEAGWAEVAHSLKLSGREFQLLRAVFDNSPEHTIASDLGISEYTVHSHMRRLFRKLRATTRTDLAVRVMQEFLRLVISPGGSLPPICRYWEAGCCPLVKR